MEKLTLDDLRTAPQVLGKMLLKRRAQLREIDALDPEWYTAKTKEAARAKTHQQIVDIFDLIRESNKAAAERLLTEARKAQQGPKLAPDAQLAKEMQESRIWARLERQLSAGFEPLELIQQAQAEKDLTALKVMKQEMPSFLASKYGAERDGRVLAAVNLDLALSQIDAAIHPLLPAGERQAIALEEELTQGTKNLEGAYSFVEEELNGYTPWLGYSPRRATSILPGWDKGSSVDVVEGEE